ncbi:hypothetical protein ACFQ0B_75790 [Nonomuraea thailandensis]
MQPDVQPEVRKLGSMVFLRGVHRPQPEHQRHDRRRAGNGNSLVTILVGYRPDQEIILTSGDFTGDLVDNVIMARVVSDGGMRFYPERQQPYEHPAGSSSTAPGPLTDLLKKKEVRQRSLPLLCGWRFSPLLITILSDILSYSGNRLTLRIENGIYEVDAASNLGCKRLSGGGHKRLIVDNTFIRLLRSNKPPCLINPVPDEAFDHLLIPLIVGHAFERRIRREQSSDRTVLLLGFSRLLRTKT